MTARHIAVGVEGGALAAELDGRQFAAALESYAHGDEQARSPACCAAAGDLPTSLPPITLHPIYPKGGVHGDEQARSPVQCVDGPGVCSWRRAGALGCALRWRVCAVKADARQTPGSVRFT